MSQTGGKSANVANQPSESLAQAYAREHEPGWEDDNRMRREMAEFGYLAVSEDYLKHGGTVDPPQTFKEKFKAKTKENPLVPIGLFATIAALTMGLRTMYTGDSKRGQFMMRARVAAQGFTLLALIGGVAHQAYKKRDLKPKMNTNTSGP